MPAGKRPQKAGTQARLHKDGKLCRSTDFATTLKKSLRDECIHLSGPADWSRDRKLVARCHRLCLARFSGAPKKPNTAQAHL